MTKHAHHVIDFNGNIRKSVDCFENQSNYMRSCPMLWKGKPYLLVGRYNSAGILRLDGFVLSQVKETEEYQTCGVMNDQFIFLCFKLREARTCVRSTDPLGEFEKLQPSNSQHFAIQIGFANSRLILRGKD